MRAIDKIIIHCSATPENRIVSVDTIREWHTSKGWSDIGYHYVISLNGDIHKGRPVERQGAHVRGHNKDSIGICYIGGVDADLRAKDTRTEAQKASLSYFLCNLMDKYEGATLHGHNEFSLSKACPSFNVQDEYKDIIDYYNK